MFKVDFKEKHDAFVQLIKSNNLLEELTTLKKINYLKEKRANYIMH